MSKDFYDRLEPMVFKMVAQRIEGVKRVLEIGCGDCRLANFLAHHTGCEMVGIDISEADFTKGKKESRKLKVPHLVNCIKGNAENLSSLLEGKFDICVSLYVLHELEKPLKVLKEAKKILKRKGQIIVIDFPKGSVAEELYDEDYYISREMKSFLQKSGFKYVNIEFLIDKELVYLTGINPE